MSLESMSPYELGLTRDPRALTHLIRYLREGTRGERRLAASAIGKLAPYCGDRCRDAVGPLVASLSDEGPQVRQYALKALKLLPLNDDALSAIRKMSLSDDRAYNRRFAAAMLKQVDPRSPTPVRSEESDPIDRSGLCQRIEDCLEAVGILETDSHNLLERLWESENQLAEARHHLDHAQNRLLARGIEGKNEAERRARLFDLLRTEHLGVEQSEKRLHLARRDQDEFNLSLQLLRVRLKGLELLAGLVRASDSED